MKTFFLAAFLISSAYWQPCFAQDQTEESILPQWMKPTDFVYTRTGLTDPFIPFIAERPENVPTKPDRPLTPLEQVAITQLELVGVIWNKPSEDPEAAMVELPDGKGFIIQKDTLIGPHKGRVISILQDSILVEEQLSDIYGQEETRIITLKLRPGEVD
ncbi:MAG: pilus assembly protein PilP [Desulfonatronovibrio sp.]|nr:pilus assembly protein PilP [Desulfovibrionales bacterium]